MKYVIPDLNKYLCTSCLYTLIIQSGIVTCWHDNKMTDTFVSYNKGHSINRNRKGVLTLKCPFINISSLIRLYFTSDTVD